MMSPVIGMVNQRKDVGTTTLTLAMASELAERGHSVLIVDNDPQADLTESLTDVVGEEANTSLLYEGRNVQPQMISNGLFLMGADIGLSMAEERSYEAIFDFKNELSTLKYDFDFILIDCPPSLGVMTRAACIAADFILTVSRSTRNDPRGIEYLLQWIMSICKHFNSGLQHLGMIMNCFDGPRECSGEASQKLARRYPSHIFNTVLDNLFLDQADIAVEQRIGTRRPQLNTTIRFLSDEILARLPAR